jgi:hypothetical protein
MLVANCSPKFSSDFNAIAVCAAHSLKCNDATNSFAQQMISNGKQTSNNEITK